MADDSRALAEACEALIAPLTEIETQVEALLARDRNVARTELEHIRDAAHQMESIIEKLIDAEPRPSLSHELRGPLTALGLQLERLKRDRSQPLAAQQELAVRRATTAVKRLTGVVESALNVPVAGSIDGQPGPARSVMAPGQRGTVLVVDDDPESRAGLADLVRDEGY
jgi:K+-sensing histidine kinase KdpD